ncbi:MAG: DUF975 family protein [Eubacterium sp.]|nr:DUF975 family protein [Eubacterium sp.]
MNLNRGLIKQQAKQLIQNNVLKLFAVSIIVSFCISAVSGGINIVYRINNIINGSSPFSIFKEDFDDYFDDYLDDYFDDYDLDDHFDDDFNNFGKDFDFDEFGKDFNNFGNESNDFYNFGYEDEIPSPDFSTPHNNPSYNFGSLFLASGIMSFLSFVATVSQILLAPLTISLAGYYVSFIRGRKVDASDGINTVFRETFKNNYGKKVALTFLRGLFCGLLCLLFFIPGIIYLYSTYFANQIMADNPDISPMQALRLSRKMVRGNRTELFVLNLSFIPWGLLCIFVFPLIYVMPYVSTTNALYYENFRIRALQQGRVTEDDFLSDQQRYNKYANIYANPNGNPYQQNGYQPYNQPNQQQYYNQPQQNYAPNQNAYYNNPPQQPQADYYSQPQTDYNSAPNEVKIEKEPQAPVKDPWEINHED